MPARFIVLADEGVEIDDVQGFIEQQTNDKLWHNRLKQIHHEKESRQHTAEKQQNAFEKQHTTAKRQRTEQKLSSSEKQQFLVNTHLKRQHICLGDSKEFFIPKKAKFNDDAENIIEKFGSKAKRKRQYHDSTHTQEASSSSHTSVIMSDVKTKSAATTVLSTVALQSHCNREDGNLIDSSPLDFGDRSGINSNVADNEKKAAESKNQDINISKNKNSIKKKKCNKKTERLRRTKLKEKLTKMIKSWFKEHGSEVKVENSGVKSVSSEVKVDRNDDEYNELANHEGKYSCPYAKISTKDFSCNSKDNETLVRKNDLNMSVVSCDCDNTLLSCDIGCRSNSQCKPTSVFKTGNGEKGSYSFKKIDSEKASSIIGDNGKECNEISCDELSCVSIQRQDDQNPEQCVDVMTESNMTVSSLSVTCFKTTGINEEKEKAQVTQISPELPRLQISFGEDLYVALDCEFVGVGIKNTSALGRCSIVDYHGNIIYDEYCRPEAPITNYRTKWSGIRRKHMKRALPFDIVQDNIRSIIQNKVVIGHALGNDFRVLAFNHPTYLIRDTSKYKGLKKLAQLSAGGQISLKKLSKALLDLDIQFNEHCSVEDARAALSLYKLVQVSWETRIANRRQKKKLTNQGMQQSSKQQQLSANQKCALECVTREHKMLDKPCLQLESVEQKPVSASCSSEITTPTKQVQAIEKPVSIKLRSQIQINNSFFGDEFWPMHIFDSDN